MKIAKIRWFVLTTALACLSNTDIYAQIHLQPYAGHIDPRGTNDRPWGRLGAAISAANGGTVRIAGGTTIYQPRIISDPVTLTSSGGDVTIGAAPAAETTFRCLAYNVRLNNGASSLPSGWADAARAAEIKTKYADWGSPDFAGFCEIWNPTMFNNHLRFFGGTAMQHEMNGFNFAGALQHSGLAAKFAQTPSNPQNLSPPRTNQSTAAHKFYRGEFSEGEGEDNQSSKGWLRARVVKDGFGIWVFMTHLQADSILGTWAGVYAARKIQMEELREDVKKLKEEFPSDVFFIMGDFNVYGEDRGPSASNAIQNEYSMNLWPRMGAGMRAEGDALSSGGIDLARQFTVEENGDRNSFFTYNGISSLTRWWSGNDEEMPLADQARLDYIFSVGSADGTVKIEPTDYDVIFGQADTVITDRGHSDFNLSDHFGVRASFRIIKTGP